MENAVESSNEKWKIKLPEDEIYICDWWEYDEKLKHIVLHNVYNRIIQRDFYDDRVKEINYNIIENTVGKYVIVKLEKNEFSVKLDEYICKRFQFEFKDVISIGLYENFKYLTLEDSILNRIELQNKNSSKHIETCYNFILSDINRCKNSIKKSLPLTSVDKDIILDKINKLWKCNVGQHFNIAINKDNVTVGDIA